MSEVVLLGGWVLIAVVCIRVLRVLSGPPRRGGAHRAVPLARDSGRAPGVASERAQINRSVPLPPPGPRRGVLLLGEREEDLDVAAQTAERHLWWVSNSSISAHFTDSRSADINPTAALGTAHVAVLGSRGATEITTALRECAAVGVALLLPGGT